MKTFGELNDAIQLNQARVFPPAFNFFTNGFKSKKTIAWFSQQAADAVVCMHSAG